jgi:hypothetical protein
MCAADDATGVSGEGTSKASGTADEGAGTEGLQEKERDEHDGVKAFTARGGEFVESRL